MSKIMGIDSALAKLGIAIINPKNEILHTQLIKTPSSDPLEQRLDYIYNIISNLLQEYKVQYVALEDNYFGGNAKVVKSLSNVVGVILLACYQLDIHVQLIPPATHKKATTGNGRAGKDETRKNVEEIFDCKDMKLKEDEIDALSLCYCYLSKNDELWEEI